MLLLALACDEGPPIAPEELADTPVSVPLVGEALLRRLSLDLRGVGPTVAELDRIDADPAELDALVDEFFADPHLEEQLTAAFSERWLTRSDESTLDTIDLGLDRSEHYALLRSLGEEAPRLAAWIAREDRPWDELVTADYTRLDALLLANWPASALDAAADPSGWRLARYEDGRPPNGIVATNGLWLRFGTSPPNLNRHRAAAITRLFLCADFLTRPVTFSSADFKESDAESTARSVSACVGCHSSLDPIASSLFGFWGFDRYLYPDLEWYHAEREELGAWYLDVEPAWFGEPIHDAGDLGRLIAADPRFGRCAVETFTEMLWKREVGLGDFDEITELWEGFQAEGRHPHALMRAIVASPTYRVGDVAGELTEEEAVRWPTRRMMSNAQLASAIEDLTGFVWEYLGYEQLHNDIYGYRVMVGGVDGVGATRPLEVPSIASVLVVKRVAEAAAGAAMERDLLDGDELLLTRSAAAGPGSAAFDEQLVTLYRRLYARRPTEAEATADGELWVEVAALDGAEDASLALLATLLRDPEFWTY